MLLPDGLRLQFHLVAGPFEEELHRGQGQLRGGLVLGLLILWAVGMNRLREVRVQKSVVRI